MTEQRTFAEAILSNKRRTTRREPVLTELDPVMPWATVEALVEPHYPKAGRGRRLLPMVTMLRIHFLQQWVNRSAAAGGGHALRLGVDATIIGHTAYYKAEDQLPWELSGGRYLVNKSGQRTDYWDAISRTHSRVRAMVEQPSHTIKRRWGFTKVRYRRLAKNTARGVTLAPRANLSRLRHRLLPQGTSCRRVRRFRPIWADPALASEYGERRTPSPQHLSALADAPLFHTARDSYLISVSLGWGQNP